MGKEEMTFPKTGKLGSGEVCTLKDVQHPGNSTVGSVQLKEDAAYHKGGLVDIKSLQGSSMRLLSSRRRRRK